MNCHIYVDGSWLFKQCGKQKSLSWRAFPKSKHEKIFFIDYSKLINLIINELRSTIKEDLDVGTLWYFSSVFSELTEIPGEDVQLILRENYAKKRIIDEVRKAGFNTDHVFEVPFKPWMIDAIKSKSYKEKKVDSAMVTYMADNFKNYENDYHAVVTGDLDVMPAIQRLMQSGIGKVILVTTKPHQWDITMQQTSWELANYPFSHGPIFLEDKVKSIMSGDLIYECVRCRDLFARRKAIPPLSQPLCIKCYTEKTILNYRMDQAKA